MGKTLKMFIEILLIFCMLSDGMTDNDNFTETWEYKGCFEDQTGSSIINSTRFNLGSNNTIQTCVHSCNEENYRYSGLKVGNCFCGHDYVRSNRRSDNSCNSSCPGDPQEICGRQWDRLSLYHIWDNSSTSAPSTEVTAWENISVPLTSFMLLQSTTTRSDKTDKSSTSAPSTEVTAWENARVSLTSFLLLQSTTIYSLTLSDKPDKTDVSLLAVYISVPVIITIAAVIAVITIFKIRQRRYCTGMYLCWKRKSDHDGKPAENITQTNREPVHLEYSFSTVSGNLQNTVEYVKLGFEPQVGEYNYTELNSRLKEEEHAYGHLQSH